MKLDNRSDLGKLRELINAKLAEIERDTGLNMKVGNISYRPDGSQASLKVEITDVSKTGEHEEANWDRLVRWKTGFEKEDFGKTISFDGTTNYKIVGYNPRARRQPIKLQRVGDGKEFKATEEHVLFALGRKGRRVGSLQ